MDNHKTKVYEERTLRNNIIVTNGGTVTLKDVDIRNLIKDNGYPGITCEKNTTLILEGNNFVYGGIKGDTVYPGIHIAPGHTLTIDGEGSLEAKGVPGTDVYPVPSGGAGIGGGSGLSCGNIKIVGGNITAVGGHGAAGIGSGSSSNGNPAECGTIDIIGGTVRATGGTYAAGIGSGFTYDANSTCGNTSIIGSGVTAVGGIYGAGIGTGSIDDEESVVSACGTITIDGGSVKAQGGGDTTYDVGVGIKDGTSVGTIKITDVTVYKTDGNPATVQQNP